MAPRYLSDTRQLVPDVTSVADYSHSTHSRDRRAGDRNSVGRQVVRCRRYSAVKRYIRWSNYVGFRRVLKALLRLQYSADCWLRALRRRILYRFSYLLILWDLGFCEPCNSYSKDKTFPIIYIKIYTLWGISRNPTTDYWRSNYFPVFDTQFRSLQFGSVLLWTS